MSNILLRETIFEGIIVNEAPLRIGAGRADTLGSPIDLPVLRIEYAGNSVPYIPGSSIKGAFRSCAESLARTRGLDVCRGLSKMTCMDIKGYPNQEDIKLGKFIEDRLRSGKIEEAVEAIWRGACIICKIFGAPSYSGKVFFSDAYPASIKEAPRTGIKTGIAIDRRTGAVYGRALFRVEYVEPGAKFKFSIRCRNLPNYALGLISETIHLLNSGFVRIGGFKTHGFGEVRFEDISFKSRDYYEAEEMKKPLLRSFKQFNDEADVEVDLSGVARLDEDGWIISEDPWKVLDRLREAWNNAAFKS